MTVLPHLEDISLQNDLGGKLHFSAILSYLKSKTSQCAMIFLWFIIRKDNLNDHLDSFSLHVLKIWCKQTIFREV